MKKETRKLTATELTRLREQAVAAVQNGESPRVVARVLGVADITVYRWLALYRAGGWGRLQARKRGGRPPKLGATEIKWVYFTVTGGDPRQLNFPWVLWTCPIVAECIYKKFGIKLSRWSVARLLRQLGLSPQRPIRRAYQQDPKAVEEWMTVTYPKIKKAAKKAKAEIHFCDESSIRSDYHSGTTWGTVGKTPVVKTTGSRFSINMIATTTARGKMRFMTFSGTMKAPTFIDFLKRLKRSVDKPVFLIVDNHSVHRSRAVKNYLDTIDGRIKLFFLPSYSPQLNPVEQAWNHVKRHNVGKHSIENRVQFDYLVRSALHRLQKLPAIIQGFFRHPDCQYAMA